MHEKNLSAFDLHEPVVPGARSLDLFSRLSRASQQNLSSLVAFSKRACTNTLSIEFL